MKIIGYIGLIALTISWVPQTIQTIKEKDCKANLYFLILSFAGSFSLMFYAFSLDDTVFSLLNLMTSAGAAVNIFYKLKANRKTA